jgi:hypothetical protein
MPAPIPERDRNVYLVGAGLSCTVGLPNTPSLLEEILALAGRTQWLQSKKLPSRVRDAITYFYSDGRFLAFGRTLSTSSLLFAHISILVRDWSADSRTLLPCTET